MLLALHMEIQRNFGVDPDAEIRIHDAFFVHHLPGRLAMEEEQIQMRLQLGSLWQRKTSFHATNNLRRILFHIHQGRDGSAEGVRVGQQNFANKAARFHV